jgi:hypothetical protein
MNPDTHILADIRTMIARYGASKEALALMIVYYIEMRDIGAEHRLRSVWARPADDTFVSADTFDLVVS